MGNEMDNTQIERYKVVYEDGLLYGISIVTKPANGFNFVALSEVIEKQKITFGSDEKKQILYGIVLRPEQLIPREFEDGTKFLLKFDSETIEKFSQDFISKGYQKNTSYNHENDNWLKGTSVVENWIVEDGDNDKGNAIGLSVEKGDWVTGIKLSDELWTDYVESGLAKGFSIDSFVRFEKINFIKENGDHTNNSEENKKTNKMSILKKLIKMFSDETEVKLATWETDKGNLTSDTFEEGDVVFMEDLELFIGEFTFEGKLYKTDAEGVIVSIEDVEVEAEEEVPTEVETPAEEVEEDLKETELSEVETEVDKDKETEEVELSEVETETEKNEKEIEELKALNLKVEELNSKLNSKLEEITKENEELIETNQQLKKQPTSGRLKAMGNTNPINFNTIEKSEESMLSAIERITKKNNNK